MSGRASLIVPAQLRPGLIAGVIALSSGAALVLQIVAGISLAIGVALAACLVAAGVLAIVVRTPPSLRADVARVALIGGTSGVIATIAYDASRFVLSLVDPSPFDPFATWRVFGQLMVGTTTPALEFLAGAAYHAVNGTSFGVAYAFLFARGGRRSWRGAVVTGLGWSLFFEGLQLLMFPNWLGITYLREFQSISAAGHLVYGGVLGGLCRWWLPRIGLRDVAVRGRDRISATAASRSESGAQPRLSERRNGALGDHGRAWVSAGEVSAAVELGTVLSSVGYSETGVRAALGAAGGVGPCRPAESGPADRLCTVVRLFLLGDPAEEGDAAAAVTPLSMERLRQLGFVKPTSGGWTATVKLTPFEDLVIAHDLMRDRPLRRDSVPGPANSASRSLARLLPQQRVERALDIGTGNGIQALLISKRATTVLGVDVNPRALRYAALNASLNGITNMTLRRGSGYDPADSEQFDLIVSNPPFVLSPGVDLVFRDGGIASRITRDVIRGAGWHLADGGLAVVLAEWPVPRGRPWAEPLASWLPDSCDAALVHVATVSAGTYAARWNAHLRSDREVFERAADRWAAAFAEHGIDSIASGAVLLRRTGMEGTKTALVEAPAGISAELAASAWAAVGTGAASEVVTA